TYCIQIRDFHPVSKLSNVGRIQLIVQNIVVFDVILIQYMSADWDVFRLVDQNRFDDRNRTSKYARIFMQILKLGVVVVLFFTFLTSCVASKTLFLVMAAGVGRGGRNFSLCNNPDTVGAYSDNTVTVEKKHTVKWIWALFLCLAAPDLLCLIRSLHRVFSWRIRTPVINQLLTILFFETWHSIGISILAFKIFPDADALQATMLTNCLCLVPCCLTLLSRKPSKAAFVLVVFDLASIAAQSTCLWADSLSESTDSSQAPNFKSQWSTPVAILACSCVWWENFLKTDSIFPPIQRLAWRKNEMRRRGTSKIYVLVSFWKICIYLAAAFLCASRRMDLTNDFLDADPFGAKPIKVTVWRPADKISAIGDKKSSITTMDWEEFFKKPNDEQSTLQKGSKKIWQATEIDVNQYLATSDDENPNAQNSTTLSIRGVKKRPKRQTISKTEQKVIKIFHTTPNDAIWLIFMQICSSFVAYQCAKLGAKILAQEFSLALPANLSVPSTLIFLTFSCRRRFSDRCFLTKILPYELFFNCPSTAAENRPSTIFESLTFWLWTGWFLSQFWVTVYLWFPKNERLAVTDSQMTLF
uniref:Chitin synthase chs-1/2 N-terminal putative transporter domain-containing protein n=1 Tax=Romanomermis culicivorax TaxID=13658 RepID=A0A915I1C2_ROMCU